MGVRFVIGRAGSGKTLRCLGRIVQTMQQRPLGEPIYWLLPRQATFEAERALTCASGLGGFCRAQVISFDKLGQEVMAECGGGAVPEVTRLGRQMILGHLLRQNEANLRFFSKVAKHPGLASRLEATLAEFDRCGKDPLQLESLIKELGATAGQEGDLFGAKLHDLHLIYKAYTDYLGQERLDPRRRMQQVMENIARSQRFRGAVVYVDGFAEFDEFERRVLSRLAKTCEQMEIMLLMDPASSVLKDVERPPHELSLFHRIEEVYRRLMKAFIEEGVNVERPVLLKEVSRFDADDLARIEAEMFPGAGGEQNKRLWEGEAPVWEGEVPAEPCVGGRGSRRAVHREGEAPAEPVSRLEERLAGPPPAPRPSPCEAEKGSTPALELVEAPDRRGEVEHAARHIRQLLAGGMRLREIAVLVRQLDLYHDLINAAFREHEIPYFVDRRRAMAHHPLLVFLRAALALTQQAWSHDAAMMLIKTGLAGLDAHEADRLENYVLEHRLRGSVWQRPEAWNWCRKLTRGDDESAQRQADESAQIDQLRRKVCEAMTPFMAAFAEASPTRSVRQIAVEVYRLFDRFGVRQTLAAWIDAARAQGQHEQAGEHEQVWRDLGELFDQMVDLLGEEQVNLADFTEILEAALETFDLALTPPTVDQVLVGQIDRTRTPEARAVLLLGLNDGVFPYAPRETSILSDGERLELQKRQFDVEAGTERRLLDENLLGYIAFTRASERLYVSRSLADHAGRPLGPSPFWRRLREMFPTIQPRVLPRDERTDPTLISTPRQLMTALMRWARISCQEPVASGREAPEGSREAAESCSLRREPQEHISRKTKKPRSGDIASVPPAAVVPPALSQADAAFPSLYQWLATYPTCDDAIDGLRFRVWRALGYDNAAFLSARIGSLVFPSPLAAGVQQIEAFASCPFRHFVRYGLNLQEREEDELIEVDLETVFHQILERLVRQMLQNRADWTSLRAQEGQELVRTYAQEIALSLRGEMMMSNARNRYLLGRIERALEQVIAFQQVAASRGEFRTAFGQIDFGFEHAKLPPLVVQTPQGNQLHLRGRIDRVDVLEEQAAFAVMDYRLWGGELSLGRVYHGLSLQLLTYLLVMQAHGQQLAGRALTPAAAFYVRLLRQLEKVDHPSEAPEPTDEEFALRGKQRGIFDGRFYHALDKKADASGSDVIAGRLKKDGSFGYKDRTDVAETDEFAALLNQVRRMLGELGDRILEGQIDIRPYRLGTNTPCPSCAYRSVCRFDPAVNRYRHISPRSRQEVLKEALERGDHE